MDICASAQEPITTDLRRWFDQHMRLMVDDELREEFGNLCDAIDAVQANLERVNDALYDENDALRHEYDEGADDERFNALMDARDRGVNAVLEDPESFWLMPLPMDADGEPIHVGDKLVGEKVGGGYCEPFEVIGYVMSNGVIEPMDEHKRPRMAKYAHHHRKDTWERIIEDATALGAQMGRRTTQVDDLVTRCRALAGEAR